MNKNMTLNILNYNNRQFLSMRIIASRRNFTQCNSNTNPSTSGCNASWDDDNENEKKGNEDICYDNTDINGMDNDYSGNEYEQKSYGNNRCRQVKTDWNRMNNLLSRLIDEGVVNINDI